MKTSIQRLTLGFAVGAQLIFFQNCSNTNFVNDDINQVNAKACTGLLINVSKPVKILFLVDNSGSNIDNEYPAGQFNKGTDNGKVWRSSILNAAIDRYKANTHISFGLATFSDNATVSQIKSASGQPTFSNDQNIVQAGVENFKNTPEGPHTPYQSALFFARDLIRQDIAENPGENAAYSVVMLSDGVPSEGAYDRNPDLVITDAQSVMDVSPGKIRLNSVFYYGDTYDPNDLRFLQKISNTGKGAFFTANTHDVFQNDDLIQYVSTEQCVQ